MGDAWRQDGQARTTFDLANRKTTDQMTKDLRMCRSVANFSTNAITLVDFDGTNLRFHVSDDGINNDSAVNSAAISANTWYFFVAWHDAAGNTINISVNNNAAASTAHSTGVYDGDAALYFRTNDAESLAENIRRLNSDREMRRAYANLAYARARERFTTKRMIDDYLQLYRSLVSVGSAAA